MSESAGLLDVTRLEGITVVTPRRGLRELEFLRTEKELRALADDPTVCRVVVDLTRTDWFGSTALGVLAYLGRAVGRRDGCLVLCNASAHEREILAVVGLAESWPAVASLPQALAAAAA